MNLTTNQFFVFHFWRKNGVSLTVSSTSCKELNVMNNLLALVGMCMFIENCILNAMGHSCVHDHSKKFQCYFLQKTKPDKNCPKWADFLLLTGLPDTIFWSWNVFYDPSFISNVFSYNMFYPVVYDPVALLRKSFFLTFWFHPHFCKFVISTKNRDCGEILLFGDGYPIFFTPLWLLQLIQMVWSLPF